MQVLWDSYESLPLIEGAPEWIELNPAKSCGITEHISQMLLPKNGVQDAK